MNSTTNIVTVHALSHEGRGIAKVEDKTVFIEGALPGETVTFVYQKRRRRYDEAKVIDVLTPSKDRVTPPCPHFMLCGGCSLQHLDPAAQIAFKQNVVLEQLQHFGGVIPETILPPVMGPTIGYRRRARLGVKYVVKKEKILVGFREKRSGLLADINQCEVLHPSVGKLILALKQLISELDAYSTIPQIEVAIGDKNTALVFRHLETLSKKDLHSLIAFGETHNIFIYLQPEGPDSVHRVSPAHATPLSYLLPEFTLEFIFQPINFTQVNAEMNQKMVSTVVDLLNLQPTDRVLDLFCGLGNFTLPMATRAAKVVGVEGSALAVQSAQQNAQHNKISNVEFYEENLQKSTFETLWVHQSYDKVLLDPPRTGAIEVIPFIASLGVKRMVYVSCNPATLARDVGELVKNHGFRLESVGVLDMFPHTTHIESIAVLYG